MVAVQYLAEIKYPGDASGTSKLAAQMAGGQGPTAHGATVSAIVIVLCNFSHYTP